MGPSRVEARVQPAAVDWDGRGLETGAGWSLQAVNQGFSRTATGAVADVPGGPRGYQVLVAITTEEPSSQLALAHRARDRQDRHDVRGRRARARELRLHADPIGTTVASGRSSLPTAGAPCWTPPGPSLREVEAALMRDLSSDEQVQLRQLLARVALGVDDVESELTPAPFPRRAAHTTPPGRARPPALADLPAGGALVLARGG